MRAQAGTEAASEEAPSFALHVVDVGNGLAAVLDVGQHELVYDGGDDPDALTEYLQTTGLVDGPIEIVVLSHPDFDHYKGFPRLLKSFPVREFWDSGFTDFDRPEGIYTRLLQQVRDLGIALRSPLRATLQPSLERQRIERRSDLLPGASITVLSADASAPGKRSSDRQNNASIVLLVEIGGIRLLFPGDIMATDTSAGEPREDYTETRLIQLARKIPDALRADILLVPHSGSELASSREFIEAVDPALAIFPYHRLFAHPRPAVVLRYHHPGRRLITTGLHPEAGQDHLVIRSSPSSGFEVEIVRQTSEGDLDWEGTLSDGTPLTRFRLTQVFMEAQRIRRIAEESALDSAALDVFEERRALRGARMAGADLAGKNLSFLDLSDADLRGADLRNAKMRGTNLRNADLSWVFLEGADLSGADLTGATLTHTHLAGTILTGTRLAEPSSEVLKHRQAGLSLSLFAPADLRKAILGAVSLPDFRRAEGDLSGAGFAGANLAKAILPRANLYRTSLAGANLSGADLRGAKLIETDLSGADLSEALLEGAVIQDARLTGARLRGTQLQDAVFEPAPGAGPSFHEMTLNLDLASLRYEHSPHALRELRQGFKNAGLRAQERELTYALERIATAKAHPLLRWIRWFFFDLTCEYGRSPWRPLALLAALILLLALVYALVLRFPGKGSLWIILAPPQGSPEGGAGAARLVRTRGLRAFALGLSFSVLSAFAVGWRDFNIGTWLSRIQSRDDRLIPVGWVRSLSGLQSLLSVFLLALWALTYFGQPFE